MMKKIKNYQLIHILVLFLIGQNSFSQQITWKENNAFTVNSLTSEVESSFKGVTESYLLSQSNLPSNDLGYVEITNFMIDGLAIDPQSEIGVLTLYFTFESNFSLAAIHQNSYSISYSSLDNTVEIISPSGEIATLNNITLSQNDVLRVEKTQSNKVLLKFNTNEYLITDNFIETGRIALYTDTDVLSFTINNSGYRTDDPNPFINVLDDDKNWIMTKTFDNAGLITSAGVGYYNELGESTQKQSRDFKTGKTWAIEIRYDYQGRPALSSFSAPLSGTALDFTYAGNFIRESDGSELTTTELELDPELPPTVQNQIGRLGWYYSNQNTYEQFQDDAEGRPYTRTVYDELNPGNVRAVAGGKVIDVNGNGNNDGLMDNFPQGFSYTMPASQEMYYAYGQDYFKEPNHGSQIEVIAKHFKTVSIDAHGNEVVSFTDAEGNLLATARSGGSTHFEVLYVIGEQGYVDIHYPTNASGGYELLGGGGYTIYDLRTGLQLASQNDMVPGNIYRIFHPDPSNGRTFIDNYGIISYNAGNKGIRYNVNYYDYALNYYDNVGRFVESVQPIGFDSNAYDLGIGTPNHSMISTYTYNASGELISTTSPDEGSAFFVYRNDGQIRFSRNDLQSNIGEFSYTNYDDYGRPIESGVSDAEIPYFEVQQTSIPNFVVQDSISSGSGSLTKIGTTNWTDSGFYSVENTGTGNFRVSFNYPKDKEGVVGLSENETNGSYTTVEHAMYFANNQISILSNGASLTRSATTYDETDNFSIERNENTMLFKKNDQVIYQYDPWVSGNPSYPALIIDGELYTQGTMVSNIEINQLSLTPTTTPPPPEDFVVDPLTCSEQVFTLYDVDDDIGLQAILGSSGYRNQRFLSGNVSKTWTKNPETSTTWYSYDVYGRVEWMVQYINGLGAKTIEYEYDEASGQVTKVIYQKYDPTELFVHKYIYNEVDQLITVETSRDNLNFVEHASYSYYETGELKRVILAEGLQGTDYVYNLNGQLKAINHPELSSSFDPGDDQNDSFGFIIDYHNKDYTRTGTNITSSPSGINRYDGNIKGTRWATQDLNVPGTQNGYLYQYNNNKWLSAATFSSVTGNVYSNGALPDYSVSGLSYDANGNIITLDRTKDYVNGSNKMDDLQYQYYSNSNQLEYVQDTSGYTAQDLDIKTQSSNNYLYNSIGQLVRNEQDNLDYTYFANGLVKEVATGGTNTTVGFSYNDRGHRVLKQFMNNGIPTNTYYIRDASGQVIAMHTISNYTQGGYDESIEYPIYGLSRIGIADPDNLFKYQLSDHLGNIRAVIQRDYNPIVIYSNDFSSGSYNSPPWVHFINSTVSVVSEELKVQVSSTIDNNVSLEFAVTAGNTYSISFDLDLDETPNSLEYGVGTGYGLGNYIANTNGHYSFNYTALTTGNVNLSFGLRNNVPAFTNNYYLDNVVINDISTNNTPIMVAYKDYYPFGMPMPNREYGPTQYRYAFQGQEKDPEIGMEAFELRLWDSRIGRWLTVDPYNQFDSPYLGMGNNPINGFDPDGGYYMKPTPEEAVALIKFINAYGEGTEGTLLGGWELVGSIVDDRESTGFTGGLFSRVKENGEIEYTFVTRGSDTDFSSEGTTTDWHNNVAQIITGNSGQYAYSIDLAAQLSEELFDYELTFVGQSLGGGLASANSLKTGREAITFNAAGLSDTTLSNKKLGLTNIDAPVTAYIVEGEIVDYIQSNFMLQLMYGVNRAYGEKIILPYNYDSGFHYVPALPPTVPVGVQRVSNHFIEAFDGRF